MSVPSPQTAQERRASLLRIAIWVAIGALIAAAFVCVIWVLVGTQNGLVPRAFLTVALLAAFAGAALLDVHLSTARPLWFSLTSMTVWIVTLFIGAFLIWMPERAFYYGGNGIVRFVSFLLIVLILQLALLHLRLFTKAHRRHPTGFTVVVTWITVGLVGVLALMLVMPLALHEWVAYHDLYWRIVVAIAILAAVGTALVPLVTALFAPRSPRPAAAKQSPHAWPTYVDGVTPLPVLPDGSPDWQAYYTGRPTYGPPAYAAPESASAPTQPGQATVLDAVASDPAAPSVPDAVAADPVPTGGVAPAPAADAVDLDDADTAPRSAGASAGYGPTPASGHASGGRTAPPVDPGATADEDASAAGPDRRPPGPRRTPPPTPPGYVGFPPPPPLPPHGS